MKSLTLLNITKNRTFTCATVGYQLMTDCGFKENFAEENPIKAYYYDTKSVGMTNTKGVLCLVHNEKINELCKQSSSHQQGAEYCGFLQSKCILVTKSLS